MIPEDEVAQRMYQALVGLCANWRLGAQSKSSVPDEKEVIDLTLDSDDDDEITNAFSPKHTTVQSTPADATANDWTMEPRSFAEDTHRATPSELLECLTRDELVLMSRRLKIPNKTKQTRPELIKAILASSSTQTTLPFSVVTKPSAASLQKSKNTLKQLFQSKPPTVAGKTQNMRLQERRVRDMCGEIFGGCLRLHDEVFQVLHLVNLVYFRRCDASASLLNCFHDCSLFIIVLSTPMSSPFCFQPFYRQRRSATTPSTRISALLGYSRHERICCGTWSAYRFWVESMIFLVKGQLGCPRGPKLTG